MPISSHFLPLLPNQRRLMARKRSLLAALLLTCPAPLLAEVSLNSMGGPGLIEMPSGEMKPDATFSFGYSRLGPFDRTALTFQISPRLSATFRYQGARNWNRYVASPFEVYYSRNFDIRYQLFEEGPMRPAISIGAQDFIGTGGESAEYIVATKNVGTRLKVTAGLGWGRLGGLNPIGQTFGTRASANVGFGGNLLLSNMFTGNVAPFGGLEYQLSDKLTLKAEYSSDIFSEEVGSRRIFDKKSPFNFGLEYQLTESIRLGAFSYYGSEFGLSAQVALNPNNRAGGGPAGPAPAPIGPRPTAKDLGWGADWITDTTARRAAFDRLTSALAGDGIEIETADFTENRAEVRFVSTKLDSRGQAIGRIARAMAANLPQTIEVFDIIAIGDGVPLSRVRINRSDLESLEHAPANDLEMFAKTDILATNEKSSDAAVQKSTYPKFSWGVTPYIKPSLFDPRAPIRADLMLRLGAQYEIAPGLVVQGQLSKRIAGNLASAVRESDSVLPKVRTDGAKYDYYGDPAVDSLTLSYVTKPGPNLYGRLTAGYLEPMFAGVSGELLWKQVDKPYAIGVEVNYVKQRTFEQKFALKDYDVITGHISGYYSFPQGYTAQLDVGRYLAGDYGATLTLAREFENGWKVGAFATLTNVSPADFGEGSFDKGILIQIPFGWATGGWTQKKFTYNLRPIQRDGGARLDVDGRLYDKVQGYQSSGLDGQWGRFWR